MLLHGQAIRVDRDTRLIATATLAGDRALDDEQEDPRRGQIRVSVRVDASVRDARGEWHSVERGQRHSREFGGNRDWRR